MTTKMRDFEELGKKIGSFNFMPNIKNDVITSFNRGDIFMADLSPTRGREQDGYRPVLVVSNNRGNKHSSIVTVIPISKMVHDLKRPTKANMPTHLFLSKEVTGLYHDSEVMCEHFRTIDKERLKNYKGTLNSRVMEEIGKCMKIALELD